VNLAEGPDDLHKLFAQALNSGDLDALVALYASDGFLMARSGSAQGIGAIRQVLAQYVAMKPTI
jgi:ketosteroid isomerase-like protein